MEAEEERKRIAFEAYVREVGVTPDGLHYFLTRREMNAFLKKQERAINRCKRAFNKIWVEDRRKNMRKRWNKWMDVVTYLRGHKRYDPQRRTLWRTFQKFGESCSETSSSTRHMA